MNKKNTPLLLTSMGILFCLACSSLQEPAGQSIDKKTVKAESPPSVIVPDKPAPATYLPPDIDSGILSAYGSPTLYPVALSYESVVLAGQATLMQFTPPAAFEIIGVPGMLYTANTALLSNPQQLTASDFPAKFTATPLTLNNLSFSFTPSQAQQLTGIFVWSVGESLLVTPLFQITVYSIPVGGTSSGDVVSVTFKEIDGVSYGNAPVRFGQVFREGAFFPGLVRARLQNAQDLPVQVDVLRSHEDGSIRHAMISLVLPNFNANTQKVIELLPEVPSIPAAVFVTGYNPVDLDAVLTLQGTGASPNLNARLQNIVPNVNTCVADGGTFGNSAYWRFNGPIMKECVVWGKMLETNGQGNAQIDVSFRIVTFSGWDGALVDVVVENTHAKLSATDSSLFPDHTFNQLKLTLGKTAPVTAYLSDGDFKIWAATRFRVPDPKSYKNQLPNPEVRRVLVDWFYARALNLLQSEDIPVAYNIIDTTVLKYGKTVWPKPGNLNLLPQNMGQTGGASWIGTEPEWDRAYLATWNRKALDTARGALIELGNMFATHVRQSSSSTAQIPGGTIGLPCNGLYDQLKPSINGAQGKPDTAHQPRTSVAYMFTGDLYDLEEHLFWSMWNLGENDCVETGQQRAIAWSLRTQVDSAWLVPDGHARYQYFQDQLNYALDYYQTQTQTPNITPGILPDEYAGTHLVVSGRPNWVNARRHSPWMHSWVCWAFQLADRRGYTQAGSTRDWVCDYLVRSYNAEDDAAEDWLAPNGTVYKYPAVDAMAYDAAVSLYSGLTPWHEIYASDCSITNPWQYMPNYTGPTNKIAKMGEVYYWSVVNKAHEGYPVANICFYENSVKASAWTPSNGLTSWGVNTYFDYGGNPGTAATCELGSTQSMSTTLNRTKSIIAYNKNETFKQVYGKGGPLSLKCASLDE